jgi:lipopolysaccharide export system permease protein
MRLLDRYLFRELLVPLCYCLSGFLVFWIAFDLFNELSRFQGHKLKALEVAEYYLVKLPELLGTVLPVALLLALLYSLTNLARHHELIAIRAAGVSLWRLSAPYFAVGLGMSLGLFALTELWSVDAQEAGDRILNRHLANQPDAAARQWQSKLHFNNDRAARVWDIGEYHLVTGEMKNPVVEWLLPDGTRRQIFAERGVWTNRVWTFYNAAQLIYRTPDDTPPALRTNELAFPEFSETPQQIKSEIKITGMSAMKAAKKPRFSIAEILEYKQLHPQLKPAEDALLNTQLHGRLAAPWTCLVVVFIALPFGALSGRRNVFVGVASSIFLCFAFFVLTRVGLALGTSGKLLPWLAAWLPNLVFGGAGLGLIWRVR